MHVIMIIKNVFNKVVNQYMKIHQIAHILLN